MGVQCNIAIVGVSVLEGVALSNLISEQGCAKGQCFLNFDEYKRSAESFDGIITDSSTLLKHLEYFLPRKNITVVVDSSECQTDDSSLTFPTIFHNSDVAEIVAYIRRIITFSEQVPVQSHELSQREKEVLCGVASGKTNKEIASELFISVNTVITHRKNISQKLGIKSASGMSLYAMMNGLI